MRRLLLLLPLLSGPAALAVTPTPANAAGAVVSTASPWDGLGLVGIDGKPLDVAKLRGRVVLVVNVASFCSYTPQYRGLEELWRAYRDRGLVVLGVPSNQFGSQEPGTDAEIRNFCRTRYGVTFPMLTKQDVNGEHRTALYRWLVGSEVGGGRDVGWNFEKFLVSRDGRVVSRWPSHVDPEDPKVRAAIEMALEARL